ncbi:MAG: hypothetical protein HDR88_13560 [Bacteroides sp.]|nr:hypothetical protein [Bacteroides sp.]
MKQIIYIISLSMLLTLTPFSAKAVTDKEMEQARTIATAAYLRYANDGSGYLDNVNAKTMAELERQLKPKEKENLQAFKAIPVPNDYKSWNKQQLLDYWGVKAFSTPGLVEKGRAGRKRAKKAISAMTVTPPSKEPEKKTPTETKPSTQAAPVAAAASQPAAGSQTPVQKAAAQPAAAQPTDMNAADSTTLNALAQAEAAADAFAQLEEDEPQLQKADNHTGVYIVVLCVLIAVVCALVVFASNVMKKNEAVSARKKKDEGEQLALEDTAGPNAMREKFAATLNAKNEEIKSLLKKIETVNADNVTLKGNIDTLTAEIASLRTRLAEANKKIIDMHNAANIAAANFVASVQTPAQELVAQAAAVAPVSTPMTVQPVQQPVTQEEGQQSVQLRTIYLGRANARGIFVRADRNLNLGSSIYRLDTTDGYAGSFRVASDPTVWKMALLTPKESLSEACVIAEPDNTAGMTKVVNDAAGTAVFEGGCWRVLRKAKVHYE